MSLSTSDFGAFHAAVHGDKQPFAWQQRLLERIVADKVWPRVLDLPTGAGKTTCIDIALFALALDAEKNAAERWCPRRIAMVVDRRIVVDQVAERGRTILHALLTNAVPVVVEVANRLRSLTRMGEEPLGVFTLRGGMPKDDGWARTPDQPLVIASTVDQVGSRMLMQGYGVSQGMKPVHAGLLANDTLLLLDEVHLSEPFRQTLDQLTRLRTRFSGSGVKTRFAHTFLSATPGTDDTEPFMLCDDEKQPDSPLGPRLHVRKPARLVEVEDRTVLEKACVDHARNLLERHRTVAVVVNRVASASAIAAELGDTLGADATVTLLTGRMRPLDRDDVFRELRPAVQTGRERSEDSPKRVIVGTQCIEAGADFDFDALVTEVASLDSLRQRFGRVDRLGMYGSAEGVIVHDKSAKDDPIYGKAIAETVRWFKEQEKERPKKLKDELRKLKDAAKKLRGEAKVQAEVQIAKRAQVDFGILALDVPTGDELRKLLAPKPNAPTLLPAYLDLWAQTSPAPSQLPDVSLWLHGPSAGPADVQVVWRADLTEDVLQTDDIEAATAIVAAVRPSGLEAMSLPFATVRAWLSNQSASDSSDAESAMLDDNEEPETGGRRALRWRGDESEIVDAKTLKPGHTLVVPAAYGGIRNGCFDAASTEPVSDRAEQAELFARARPVLRLQPAVIGTLGLSLPLDEPGEARAALGRLASNGDWPAWKRLWAQKLAVGRRSLVVPGTPSWSVLYARRVPLAELRGTIRPDETLEDGVELTTDGDDSFYAGRAVSLAEHSIDVESFAREFAMRCGLGVWLAEHIALAAWLHDIGKADPRFQLMLRGGSKIEFFKDETLQAKSAMPPGAREAHRLAQQRSGYPRGARHEVQSLAMLSSRMDALKAALQKVDPQQAPDLDLVLHLVASHHGYCRPFAPAVTDEVPVDISLDSHASKTFGTLDFAAIPSDNKLHQLDSPLADRFWALVEKYGWQELCWLEAILRLADHRASEAEQGKEALS
ncbi:MAG TPA: type I-U CRISPR-associated helicase/endonuclease Cas3 [Povalibacter sp.]|uniref:type I-G CRISPR-associated helicase/endonuclease Cas3g n=1 Tax=Povalibacter sp. TaxID=1962978 RepID=UPI002D01A231|nr:type I-U CRISPR-associated helicase/endonuclease Cas3 [Povalibacter sp.]HMN44172.1 type I-U CRISPR-associated helicase/endonuclease Cas3 [Povalibacter sp.]